MEQDHIFDKENLLSHVGGDDVFFKQIIIESIRLLPQYLGDVNQAFETGNADTIRRTAHRLKGALVTLHAEKAASSAKTIEQYASDGKIDDATASLPELIACIDELISELRKYSA
jgi:HPt (histidine-containing phosphotransfer) domain-containing protein